HQPVRRWPRRRPDRDGRAPLVSGRAGPLARAGRTVQRRSDARGVMSAWDAVPIALLLIKLLLIAISLVFFASGIDDAFVDVVFAVRAMRRWLFVDPRARPLTVDDLVSKDEQPIAIMIPAWHEADVIRRMLLNAVSTIAYAN